MHYLKFSLRELLLLMTLAGISLGWFINWYEYYQFIYKEYPPRYPKVTFIYDNAIYGPNLTHIRNLNVSSQHPEVEIDSVGYVWISYNNSVSDCQKCHKDTWNHGDSWLSHPQRLGYRVNGKGYTYTRKLK